MNIILKEKLNITEAFIEELTEKSWQEIDHIQNQLANLDDTAEGKRIGKLLNRLLTSYYVFVGELENFYTVSYDEPEQPTKIKDIPIVKNIDEIEQNFEPAIPASTEPISIEDGEPFEYFVDFDDPIGAPLTDEDLYNK